MGQDEFLNVQEAAFLLRVRCATLYIWVHQRRIPFRKHGGRLVFSRCDLLKWSEARKVTSLPQGGMIDPRSHATLTSASPKTRRSLKTRHSTADDAPDSLSKERE
jgi:excisionase family DNA binding protein